MGAQFDRCVFIRIPVRLNTSLKKCTKYFVLLATERINVIKVNDRFKNVQRKITKITRCIATETKGKKSKKEASHKIVRCFLCELFRVFRCCIYSFFFYSMAKFKECHLAANRLCPLNSQINKILDDCGCFQMKMFDSSVLNCKIEMHLESRQK